MKPEEIEKLKSALDEEEQVAEKKGPGVLQRMGKILTATSLPMAAAWGGVLGAAEGFGKQEAAPLSTALRRAGQSARAYSFEEGQDPSKAFGYADYAKELGFEPPSGMSTIADILGMSVVDPATYMLGGASKAVAGRFRGQPVKMAGKEVGGVPARTVGGPGVMKGGEVAKRQRPVAGRIAEGSEAPIEAAGQVGGPKRLSSAERKVLPPHRIVTPQPRGEASQAFPGKTYKSTQDLMSDAIEELAELQRHFGGAK